MTGLGQSRRFRDAHAESGSAPITDICRRRFNPVHRLDMVRVAPGASRLFGPHRVVPGVAYGGHSLDALDRTLRKLVRYRRRATAIPNKNATSSEPRGASRAKLLKMLNGMPGFRPSSIAAPIRCAVPFTASETSATVDFGSGAGSKPS